MGLMEAAVSFVSTSRNPFAERIRVRVYRKIVARMGRNVLIRSGIIMKEPQRVSIGSNVSIQENCYISGWGGVTIGDEVSIGNGSKIVSSEHQYTGKGPIRRQPLSEAPVTIGSNVWIGMGVCVLGGSKIHDNVIVGAGAVVKGELLSNGVYVGVPARRIKEIAAS